ASTVEVVLPVVGTVVSTPVVVTSTVDVVSVVAGSPGGSLHAAPSAALRVTNMDKRTVNTFLIVYVDERTWNWCQCNSWRKASPLCVWHFLSSRDVCKSPESEIPAAIEQKHASISL